jgi:S1-C subfamily serine protease
MKHRRHASFTIALSLLWLTTSIVAAEKGWFGFAIKVDAEEASVNPVLRSITVEKVFDASPAAQAGLLVGDSVLQIQGIVVAGARAEVLRAALNRPVGETLHLKVKRGPGDIRDISIIAVQNPQGR